MRTLWLLAAQLQLDQAYSQATTLRYTTRAHVSVMLNRDISTPKTACCSITNSGNFQSKNAVQPELHQCQRLRVPLPQELAK